MAWIIVCMAPLRACRLAARTRDCQQHRLALIFWSFQHIHVKMYVRLQSWLLSKSSLSSCFCERAFTLCINIYKYMCVYVCFTDTARAASNRNSQQQWIRPKLKKILNNSNPQTCHLWAVTCIGWWLIQCAWMHYSCLLTKMGPNTNTVVDKSLITTCNAGPAVSLNGSPTVSPVTEAAKKNKQKQICEGSMQ